MSEGLTPELAHRALVACGGSRKTLAEACGVSVDTISNALNGGKRFRRMGDDTKAHLYDSFNKILGESYVTMDKVTGFMPKAPEPPAVVVQADADQLACITCGKVQPHTEEYFPKAGSRLRLECHKCAGTQPPLPHYEVAPKPLPPAPAPTTFQCENRKVEEGVDMLRGVAEAPPKGEPTEALPLAEATGGMSEAEIVAIRATVTAFATIMGTHVGELARMTKRVAEDLEADKDHRMAWVDKAQLERKIAVLAELLLNDTQALGEWAKKL